MKLLLLSLVVMGLGACANIYQPKVLNISSGFDNEVAESMMSNGNNTIKGTSFLRQNGGAVVTCAGYTITLVPETRYAKERMVAIYGENSEGKTYVAPSLYTKVVDPKEPANYQKLVKTATCDQQGNFEFDNIVDGKFYLISTVVWRAGDFPQGAKMMQPISVHNGESKKVIMTVN